MKYLNIKDIAAIIVLIIAILFFIIAHSMKWGLIFEIILLCISFLASSYLIFFDTFIKELGKETAKSLMLEKNTTIVEQVKIAFSKELELYKADLLKSNKFFEINYAKFQDKRFDVIVELYAKLATMIGAVYELYRPYESGANEEEVFKEREKKYQECSSDYENFLEINRLFLDDSFYSELYRVIDSLEQLYNDYKSAFDTKYRKNLSEQEKSKAENNFSIMTKRLSIRLDRLENNLRSIIFPENNNTENN